MGSGTRPVQNTNFFKNIRTVRFIHLLPITETALFMYYYVVYLKVCWAICVCFKTSETLFFYLKVNVLEILIIFLNAGKILIYEKFGQNKVNLR